MKNVLIIGATSAIAHATARLYAQHGAQLYLIGRNKEKLDINASDLQVLGASSVFVDVVDLDDVSAHQGLIDRCINQLNSIDIALIAHGTLADQAEIQTSYEKTLEALTTNGLSYLSLLTRLANYFEPQRKGTIAVISSVAGDRGRQSNYIYGTAKAAVSTFTQGLRNRLAKSGVNVLTIKPGFVDTPMTADFDKSALWASPEKVGAEIFEAIKRGKDIIYTPFFWRYIMIVIKSIPEILFKKLNL
ncbi:MAG: SDR family oxidoreductase [Pseudomonadales bacterium]|nr:SDR family oxidoreductase [Pseudomonadales bacterium]